MIIPSARIPILSFRCCRMQRDLYSQEQPAELQQLAHTFKASGQELGAARLAAICQEIENCGREAIFAGVDELIDQAEKEARIACLALQKIV